MRLCIKSVSTTAGFLERCPVEFAPGLTCIIGARGTCKSTLVESIRFAFGLDADKVKILLAEPGASPEQPSQGLIRETLENGTVHCEVGDFDIPSEPSYSVERDINSEPRLHREGIREHADKSMLRCLEIYSQGDLQRVAENSGYRLALIDRANSAQIAELEERQSQEAAKLRSIGNEIRVLRETVEMLSQELKELPLLKEALGNLQKATPPISAEIGTHRAAYFERDRIIESARTAADRISAAAEDLLALSSAIDEIRATAAPLRRSTEAEAAAILDALERAVDLLQRSTQYAGEIERLGISKAIEFAKQAFAQKDKTYFKLLEAEKALHEQLRKEDQLQKQIQHFAAKQQEFERIQWRQSELQDERKRLRNLVGTLSNEIFKLRLSEVERINKEHGDVVLLTLTPGSQTEQYRTNISALLAGSRIRNQEDVAADLAAKLLPSELIDIVEARAAQSLSEILDRDLGQMTRVIAHLADHDQLYDIESIVLKDRLDITMYDDGQPKAVETLSKGQKATALLPLILRELPYPLIFDQPEDDLDNKFIIDYLVNNVGKLKSKRQLIFVTHNANIPVLGDADRVIVMNMQTPTRAGTPVVGSVDDRRSEILDLLEGGADAFRRRQQRYGSLLPRS